MLLKFSEMCAVRTDLALRLEAAFDNYMDEIAQGYGAYLAPAIVDGEPEIDARHQLMLLRRKVQHHRQRIDNLDEGVLEQIHGDEKVRAELDQRAEGVDGKLRRVRSAYRGFYGLDNLGRVGLEGVFPRGVLRLHRHAVMVRTSLESPDLDLEPLLELDLEKKEGERTSVAVQLGAQLDPELTRLGELLDERHQESTRTTDARLQRQEVIRDFDYNVRGIVRMAQGMFRLAGRSDLAKRIRPILQRVLRKLEDQEAAEAAETESDAASEAGEATETTGNETAGNGTAGNETGEVESAGTDEAAASEETTA